MTNLYAQPLKYMTICEMEAVSGRRGGGILKIQELHINKAIRDGRPRPPRHQVGWDIVTRECACQISWWSVEKWRRYYIIEISRKHVSVTYDLDLWPKILKIFVSHGVPIRNMYAKFHNDRLRNGWDITLWNFAKTRTNTDTHTNTQTNRHGHYNTSPSPYGGRGKYSPGLLDSNFMNRAKPGTQKILPSFKSANTSISNLSGSSTTKMLHDVIV